VQRPAVSLVVVLALALASCASSPPPASVTAVALQPGDQPLAVGATLSLNATVTATGGAGTAVAWSASCGTVAGTTAGTATYTAPTAPQTCAVTATSVSDGARSATVTLTIVAGEPAALAVATQPATAASGALLTSQPVVRVVDAYGNLAASDAQVTVAIVNNELGLLDGTTTVTAAGGVAVFTDLRLVGTAGSYVLLFAAPGLAGATAEPIALAAGNAGSNSYIMADPQSLVADGVGTSTIRVVLVDGEGNLLTSGGDIVTIEVDRGSVGPVTDHGNGTYTAVFTAGTVAGRVGVTANVATYLGIFPAYPPGPEDVITLVPGPADVETSTVEANPTSLVQDGSQSSQLTVRLYDTFGNAIPYSDGTVDFQAPGTGSIGPVTDHDDGTYTATYTASAALPGSMGGTSFDVVIVPRLDLVPFGGSFAISLEHPCPEFWVWDGGTCQPI
jgi:adhesin/invasin